MFWTGHSLRRRSNTWCAESGQVPIEFPDQLHVFWEDCHAFWVDCTQIGVLEQTQQMHLGSCLKTEQHTYVVKQQIWHSWCKGVSCCKPVLVNASFLTTDSSQLCMCGQFWRQILFLSVHSFTKVIHWDVSSLPAKLRERWVVFSSGVLPVARF